MAAIIQPRRLPVAPAPRPALRLVSAHDGRPVAAPVDLGLTPLHLAGAVVALVAAMLLALAIGNGALAGLAPSPPAAVHAAAAPAAATSGGHVTVHAGDTLWSIARQLQPSGDVRPLVDRLIELNGTMTLQPGERLTVPS